MFLSVPDQYTQLRFGLRVGRGLSFIYRISDLNRGCSGITIPGDCNMEATGCSFGAVVVVICERSRSLECTLRSHCGLVR